MTNNLSEKKWSDPIELEDKWCYPEKLKPGVYYKELLDVGSVLDCPKLTISLSKALELIDKELLDDGRIFGPRANIFRVSEEELIVAEHFWDPTEGFKKKTSVRVVLTSGRGIPTIVPSTRFFFELSK